MTPAICASGHVHDDWRNASLCDTRALEDKQRAIEDLRADNAETVRLLRLAALYLNNPEVSALGFALNSSVVGGRLVGLANQLERTNDQSVR